MKLLGVSSKLFITGFLVVILSFAGFLIDKEFNSTNFMDSTSVTYVKRLDDETHRIVASDDEFESEYKADRKLSSKIDINIERMNCSDKNKIDGKWRIYRKQMFHIENDQINDNPETIDEDLYIVDISLQCNQGQTWSHRIIADYKTENKNDRYQRFIINTVGYINANENYRQIKTLGVFTFSSRMNVSGKRNVHIVEMEKIGSRVSQQITNRRLDQTQKSNESDKENSIDIDFPPKDIPLTFKKVVALPEKAKKLVKNLVKLDPESMNIKLKVRMEYKKNIKRYVITQISYFSYLPDRNSNKLEKKKYSAKDLEDFENFMNTSDNEIEELGVNSYSFHIIAQDEDFPIRGTIMHTQDKKEHKVTLRFATGTLGNAGFFFTAPVEDQDQDQNLSDNNDYQNSEPEDEDVRNDDFAEEDENQPAEDVEERRQVSEFSNESGDQILSDEELEQQMEDEENESDISQEEKDETVEEVGFNFQNKSAKRSLASLMNEK